MVGARGAVGRGVGGGAVERGVVAAIDAVEGSAEERAGVIGVAELRDVVGLGVESSSQRVAGHAADSASSQLAQASWA